MSGRTDRELANTVIHGELAEAGHACRSDWLEALFAEARTAGLQAGRDEAKARMGGLEEALRKLVTCRACRGTGACRVLVDQDEYDDRDCGVCGGDGLNQIARVALAATPGAKTHK